MDIAPGVAMLEQKNTRVHLKKILMAIISLSAIVVKTAVKSAYAIAKLLILTVVSFLDFLTIGCIMLLLNSTLE